MTPVRGTLAWICVLAWAPAAPAQELCGQITRLLAAPPAGFLADRGAAIGAQRWTSPNFLPHAQCVIWASRTAEAHNIRCTVNDEAAPALVSAYFAHSQRIIDQCLAALPTGRLFVRRVDPVASEGLQGQDARWIADTDRFRIQIELTDYRRVVLGSSYNSLSVEYLKY